MSKKKILVVDDSKMMRNLVMKSLKGLDFEIHQAENGKKGLEAVLGHDFDLIITDIEMPEMNGIDFCYHLKNMRKTMGIPIVINSSFDSDKDIEKGFKAGASGYVSKSEPENSLRETATNILSKSSIKRTQKILIVDDSESIRRIIEDGLIELGYQVFIANNGKEALKQINNIRPNLILSDINMPVMDGFEFCKAIHTNPNLASIPFIAMSTLSDRGIMKRIIKEGAEAYITKPFNIDELVILIEKLLSDNYLMLLKEKEHIDNEKHLILASITSLVSALEARDPYTKGHSEEVAAILAEMAKINGFSKQQISLITIGGKLHDIGKIGVKDSILLKPGKLTIEEFEQIKQHPTIGANILLPIDSLKDIVDIVLYHHERFDGKGYPSGIKGTEIPLLARMTSVADTYSALVTNRPYRKGMSINKAIKIIREVTGTQLCPECVKIFMKWKMEHGFL